jgi:CheY-like chemotaxis protein
MQVLIVSSSSFRRRQYQQAIESLGHEVTLAHGGVDCLEQFRVHQPDVLVLEAPIPWGGSEGVLDLLQSECGGQQVRVILVAVGMGPIDWFQLSRFRLDDLLFRVPTAHDWERSLGVVSAAPAAPAAQLAVPHCA